MDFVENFQTDESHTGTLYTIFPDLGHMTMDGAVKEVFSAAAEELLY